MATCGAGFENRFVRDFRAGGQDSTATYELLTLPAIKENKEAAAARFRAAGADAVLIVRLVDQATYSRTVQATPEHFVPTVTGYGNYGWYDAYSVAFMDMGTTVGQLQAEHLSRQQPVRLEDRPAALVGPNADRAARGRRPSRGGGRASL